MSRSVSKTATPVSDAHPAHNLTFVDAEIQNQLLKTPIALLLENETYQIQLKDLRNDWRYAFVLQWLYYFRGAIKLSGEPFTVDLVEEELVGLTEQNLINKIATNLAAALLGTKVNMSDFSFRARYLLGDSTDVLGSEETPVDYQALSLVDKFEVLFLLIHQLQYTEIFRKQIEKYEKESDLRFDPIYEDEVDSYYLLSDNRIYKRSIISFPKVHIPKKLRDAKKTNPETDLADIEPELDWQVVAIGIYQIHDFLVSIQKNKKLKPLFQNIKDHIDELAQEDLQTRRKVLKRKREQQLNDLVSNRKRSSRIQEKEEQLKAEKQKQEEEAERYRQEQEKAKAQKRYKQKLNSLKRDYEERLRTQTASRRSVALSSDYKPSSLDDVELDEGEWLFECYCGIREKNYDDGVKLISCERCHRWQHLKCQDRAVRQELVRNSNEVFICQWCHEEIEHEVAQKLEEERIQREREAIEKQRQRELNRELQKQREEEERIKKEEEEKRKKEELEQERQRRILERERAKEMGQNVGSSVEPLSKTPSVERLSQHEFSQAPLPSLQTPNMGPRMGTFHQPPQQQFPGMIAQPVQTNGQSQNYPQFIPPPIHFQPPPPPHHHQQGGFPPQFQGQPPQQQVFPPQFSPNLMTPVMNHSPQQSPPSHPHMITMPHAPVDQGHGMNGFPQQSVSMPVPQAPQQNGESGQQGPTYPSQNVSQ